LHFTYQLGGKSITHSLMLLCFEMNAARKVKVQDLES